MLLTTQHRHPSAVFERKTSEARSFSGAGGRNSERERLGSAAGLGDDSSESAEAEPWPGRDVGRRSSPGPPLTIQSPGKIFSRVGIQSILPFSKVHVQNSTESLLLSAMIILPY